MAMMLGTIPRKRPEDLLAAPIMQPRTIQVAKPMPDQPVEDLPTAIPSSPAETSVPPAVMNIDPFNDSEHPGQMQLPSGAIEPRTVPRVDRNAELASLMEPDRNAELRSLMPAPITETWQDKLKRLPSDLLADVPLALTEPIMPFMRNVAGDESTGTAVPFFKALVDARDAAKEQREAEEAARGGNRDPIAKTIKMAEGFAPFIAEAALQKRLPVEEAGLLPLINPTRTGKLLQHLGAAGRLTATTAPFVEAEGGAMGLSREEIRKKLLAHAITMAVLPTGAGGASRPPMVPKHLSEIATMPARMIAAEKINEHAGLTEPDPTPLLEKFATLAGAQTIMGAIMHAPALVSKVRQGISPSRKDIERSGVKVPWDQNTQENRDRAAETVRQLRSHIDGMKEGDVVHYEDANQQRQQGNIVAIHDDNTYTVEGTISTAVPDGKGGQVLDTVRDPGLKVHVNDMLFPVNLPERAGTTEFAKKFPEAAGWRDEGRPDPNEPVEAKPAELTRAGDVKAEDTRDVHQMTQDEYAASKHSWTNEDDARTWHRLTIEDAINRGEQVDPKVLETYPDLYEKATGRLPEPEGERPIEDDTYADEVMTREASGEITREQAQDLLTQGAPRKQAGVVAKPAEAKPDPAETAPVQAQSVKIVGARKAKLEKVGDYGVPVGQRRPAGVRPVKARPATIQTEAVPGQAEPAPMESTATPAATPETTSRAAPETAPEAAPENAAGAAPQADRQQVPPDSPPVRARPASSPEPGSYGPKQAIIEELVDPSRITSPMRRSDAINVEEAIDKGYHETQKALVIANDAVANSRDMTPVETAGTTVAAARLMAERDRLSEDLFDLKDPTEIRLHSAEIERTQGAIDTILMAQHQSNSIWGQAGNAKQMMLRIGEPESLPVILARARIRKGEQLTHAEVQKYETMTKEHADLKEKYQQVVDQLNNQVADNVLSRSKRRAEKTSPKAREEKISELAKRATELLRAGCRPD